MNTLKKVISISARQSLQTTFEESVRYWHQQYPRRNLPPLINQYQLPDILPKQWSTTSKKLSASDYDPKKSGTRTNFIRCTGNPAKRFQSTKTITAPRAHLFLNETHVLNTYFATKCVCYAHGGFTDVHLLDSDHLQASSNIVHRQMALLKAMNDDHIFAEKILADPRANGFIHKRIQEGEKTYIAAESYYKNFTTDFLVKAMNKNEKLAEQLMSEPEMAQHFAVHTGPGAPIYVGSLLFFKVFHNDVENLWLMCKKCNQGHAKHNQDPIKWLKENPLYGPEFVKSISPIDTSGFLLKTKYGEGIASAAKKWFWAKHFKMIRRDILSDKAHQNMKKRSREIDKEENKLRSAKRRRVLELEDQHHRQKAILINALSVEDFALLDDSMGDDDDDETIAIDETDALARKEAIEAFLDEGLMAFNEKQRDLNEKSEHAHQHWKRIIIDIQKKNSLDEKIKQREEEGSCIIC